MVLLSQMTIGIDVTLLDNISTVALGYAILIIDSEVLKLTLRGM